MSARIWNGKTPQLCQKWHGHAKILHLVLLNVRDLSQGAHAASHDHAKPCFLPCFRVNSINVLRSTCTKGHGRTKAALLRAK